MIDGSRETLRWIKKQLKHASPVMKVLYGLLFALLLTAAVIFMPFVDHLRDYYTSAHPFAQSVVLVFLVSCVIFYVVYSYERAHRVDRLKEQIERLEQDGRDGAQKLTAAQTAVKELESRWSALIDVESRQNIWKRPWHSIPRFVPMGGRNTRFLAMLNLKGGVGKTTVTANVAACLALMPKPLRVLIVDLDFQGNLSDHTVDPDVVLMQGINGNTVVRLLDADFKAESLPRLFTPMYQIPGVKVILATDELESMDFRLQAEFFVKADREVRYLFRERLHSQPVFQQFDLVVFDCPPRLTTSTVNALTCSDFVVIPTKLDQDSINSVPRTIKWLDHLAGIASGQLIGVLANDVSVRAGGLTSADQRSYNYLCEVVAQWRAGNRDFVFRSTIKSDTSIPPSTRGVVACVDEEQRALFQGFVVELRQRINL